MATTTKRLTDKAKPWIVKALREFGADDQVTWDLGFTTFPDPSAPDLWDTGATATLIPALVVYLEIPTGDNNTPSVYMNAILAPYALTESRVSDAVKATLETLREAREVHLESKS